MNQKAMHIHPMIFEDLFTQFNKLKLEKIPALEKVIENKNKQI
jgi:hypothetical protein